MQLSVWELEIPLPVAGPILGALIGSSFGAMAGAVIGEWGSQKKPEQILKIGQAAFIGRLVGSLAKIGKGSAELILASLANLIPY